jgi:hypothetical protein
VENGSFRQHYERLTDDELNQVVADSKDLIPEAALALDREISKRHLEGPDAPTWTRTPDSSDVVASLEDYNEYNDLLERKRSFGRFWYLIALGPIVLGVVFGRQAFENSEPLVLLSLAWAMCICGYMLFLNLPFLSFRCPQCAQSFGRGPECFNCGFPRSSKAKSKDGIAAG